MSIPIASIANPGGGEEFEPCENCKGTGMVDVPSSDSDPYCPKCDGQGIFFVGSAPEAKDAQT